MKKPNIVINPEVCAGIFCVIFLVSMLAHDIEEDCLNGFVEQIYQLNRNVYDLMIDCSNPSRFKPELRRAERKEIDIAHIAKLPYCSKFIKLCDRLDNYTCFKRENKNHKFALKYKGETSDLLKVCYGSDASWYLSVWNQLWDIVQNNVN